MKEITKELNNELDNEDNSATPLNKKIRKVVEEIITQYEDEFKEKFSEEEMIDVLKHKAQIGKLAVEDKQIEELLKEEVEDCIGAYLIKKSIKKK